PVLCGDRVRMIGDRIVAVAAESKVAAEEAARLVEVEYEELPLVTIENALDDDATIIHPDAASYAFLGPQRRETPHPNVHGYALAQKSETGEKIEDVFARAEHVFEHTFKIAREFQGFLEPRACVLWIDDDDRVHITNTNKAPGQFRRQLATSVGIA